MPDKRVTRWLNWSKAERLGWLAEASDYEVDAELGYLAARVVRVLDPALALLDELVGQRPPIHRSGRLSRESSPCSGDCVYCRGRRFLAELAKP